VKREFETLHNKSFDLLVCGGGIYGAWTAYDAALRGLKVAIVEQGDWASATSSASSKLIHGGLRYLETYDFGLVKKALLERQMLLNVAPHRVWPLRFGVPVYADSRVSRLQLKLGLMLYDFFAPKLLKIMAHRYFGSSSFSTRFSVLSRTNLKGGFTYTDAQTDDARLVLELISGAMAAGAVCVNYCKLETLTEHQGQVSGAIIQDQLGGATIEIKSRQVVFATGQWSTISSESKQWCRVSKGVHLLLPSLLTDEALLLTSKTDGRVFFMIPWYGLTVIGTTDTDYQGDIQQVRVEEQEVAYLLSAANHYLQLSLKSENVIASFAGLRVMKSSEKSSPSDVSRDWSLKTAQNGVHYSIGGKITSAREDAACIVDFVCEQLGRPTPCFTRGRLFPWAPQGDYEDWFARMSAIAAQFMIDAESAKWLIRRHGTRVEEIFQTLEKTPAWAERIVASVPFIYADLIYCARHEMVVNLVDLLRRRMPLMILSRLNEQTLRDIAERIAAPLGWDDKKMADEIATCFAA
jgi:glycerol-3-phosphate dehydrogenase